MASYYATLQRAKKILGNSEELEPRQYCVEPYRKSGEKSVRRSGSRQKSLKKSIASPSPRLKKDFSFCASKKSLSKVNMNSSTSSIRKKQSNASFTSAYGRQTRLDKIMRLKVKPSYERGERNDRTKKSVLEQSFSSVGTERSASMQNRPMNKVTRLDRIMQIKVSKPNVASTLASYEPRRGSRSVKKERQENHVREWRESQNKIRKSREQDEKEDRLWRVFERERDIRCKLKRAAEEREYKQQRRKEKRFESMVAKELERIEKEREVSKRKSEGFANYVYPAY